MGVITDFLTAQTVFDNSENAQGIDRVIKRYFENLQALQGDPVVATPYVAVDEQHDIAQHVPTVSGGTFTLTINLKSGETFTTAAIAFAASAATIETAIDVAATALPVTGWTNGDISVSGGDLNTAIVVLDYDGASVSGLNHLAMSADGALLTGGGSMGATSTVVGGQTDRRPWSVLNLMNGYTGSAPLQGSSALLGTVLGTRGSMHLSPPEVVLRAVALQAAIDDGNAVVETEILDGLRANGVSV